MPMELESDSSVMTASNSASGETSVSSVQHPVAAVLPLLEKKKRNLPGMPDPDAEVIALSPKSLLTTNRFVCEICKKGFKRDQNLQLHRRGHNLPWKLRLRTGKELKKRVYVCPEPSCVHHDPSRALGDLTGIKKHFFRKHGEKKWKCDKCSKRYAVQSDWKAHAKTCGTREYRCDCGTLFSRRDSFITHRAFCDALADESAKVQTSCAAPGGGNMGEKKETMAATPATFQDQQMAPPQPAPVQQEILLPALETATGLLRYLPPQPASISVNSSNSKRTTKSAGSSNSGTTTTASVFASLFSSSGAVAKSERTSFSDLIGSIGGRNHGGGAAASVECHSLRLSSNDAVSLFNQESRKFAAPPPSAHMSATALLQKATQMGVGEPSSYFLRSFGLADSSSPYHGRISNGSGDIHWHSQQQNPMEPPEPTLPLSGLGLGLPYSSRGATAGRPDLMIGSASMFGPKPATLDFLGIGMDPASSANSGDLSAFITSIGSGGIDVYPGAAAGVYGGQRTPPDKEAAGKLHGAF